MKYWYTFVNSVADPYPIGSEPFWSDPDSINCSDPDPTIKSHNKISETNFV